MTTEKNKRAYRHFLSYDQDVFPGVSYGITDLFYDHDPKTLFIKKVDHRFHDESELRFPIKNEHNSIEDELKEFLVSIMSFRTNFLGYPLYERSDIFTEEAFANMRQQAMDLIDERDEIVRKNGEGNALIEYCESLGLNPVPEGTSPDMWLANCLSRGNHQLHVSTETNTWGCGYCKKKGDLRDLKAWYEKKSKS